MKILWEAFVGIGAAVITAMLVVGALALAMTEGMVLPVAAEPPTAEPTSAMETFFPGFATPTPRSTPRPTPANRLVPATPKPAVQICPTPLGWEQITVANGDTLAALAAARGVSPNLLMEKNCLVSASLIPGSQLYLPPVIPTQTPQPLTPTATLPPSLTPSITPLRCGPPRGWVRYTVQAGDNLYRISFIFSTTVADLQLANCLGWSIIIHAGEILYVPNVAPRYTPTFTATSTPLPPTATRTLKPVTVTPIPATRTFTPVFTATRTFTPVFTATFTFTPIATRTFTWTPAATFTPTPGGTNTPVRTSTPTATFTFTPTGK